MEQGFQGTSLARISKDALTHALPVQAPVRCLHVGAEAGDDGGHGGTAGRCQLMGDAIAVDDRGAEPGKLVGGRALAAADAAGQADDQAAVHLPLQAVTSASAAASGPGGRPVSRSAGAVSSTFSLPLALLRDSTRAERTPR